MLPAFASLAPYCSLIVELDEDPVHLRMSGLLESGEPAIGDRVDVAWEPVGERLLPVWRLRR
jgi:uncharacterized OB-fold protein